MSRHFICRHRFWLYAICGASEEKDFNLPLIMGDAFHNAIETYALGRVSADRAGQRIKDYFHKFGLANPKDTWECAKWSRIAYDQFLAYADHWKAEDAKLTSLMEEQTFSCPYTLPSGRTVKLRGKWDGVVQSGEGSKKSTLLMEHKQKSEVDTVNLATTLAQNTQILFYLIPLYLGADRLGIPRPEGVLYNVIQRPLAGRKHAIKQKKGRRVKNKSSGLFEIKGAETQEMYNRRLAALYTEHPDDFFYRWKIAISEDEVERFKHDSLNPMLEQLCDWWDSIEGDPFNPWETRGSAVCHNLSPNGDVEYQYEYPARDYKALPNKLHYRRPFGIYDKMAKGLVGDFQAYLTTGNKDSLQKVSSVFPELE